MRPKGDGMRLTAVMAPPRPVLDDVTYGYVPKSEAGI